MTKIVKNNRFARRSFESILAKLCGTTIGIVLGSELAMAAPNGVWLSQPQIRFHSSTNTLAQVMADIQGQNYKVVFLDFRNVPDAVQQQTAQIARQQGLKPIVWIQSPQYRSLRVPELIHEARHGDGIQVDDHFFAHYTLADFRALRFQYSQPIFCSIQPFQAALVPQTGCNQLDVQCYTSNNFTGCEKLADRLKAVLSLYDKDTYRYKEKLGGRPFNVFLWPYSHKYFGTRSKVSVLEKTLRPFSFCQLSSAKIGAGLSKSEQKSFFFALPFRPSKNCF
ncbi:hypothetical protein [Pleurocapsa sp. PCC 7327]|uniref:hypothetical protein n=1 Tax=Pleurocapsa sp. PCC 7327 TaxID=118163 RepID=UPI001C2F999C|nr:hypothetical protein [Pleurocapsa sp. PCC 7327]